MTQKINMSKKKFRIGDLARALQVKKFVIRFWEKEFALKSDRSQGGQRYYTDDDFRAFSAIKDLLYEQGYTIAGAKTQLEIVLQGNAPIKPKESKPVEIKAAVKTVEKHVRYIPKEFLERVRVFKKKLLEFREQL